MANSDIRVVGLEIQNNIATLKAAADALASAVDTVNTAAAAWTLNSDDVSLPTALEVQAQLTAYNALSTTVVKPALSLNDSITVIQEAE